MKKIHQAVKNFLTDSVGLPAELFSDFPGISITKNRLMIENHKGLLSFSTQEICLLTGSGQMQIQGEHLVIQNYNDRELVLIGNIVDVKFIEKA